MCEEELLRDFESLIEVEGTSNGLKCIGENIGILIASSNRLST